MVIEDIKNELEQRFTEPLEEFYVMKLLLYFKK